MWRMKDIKKRFGFTLIEMLLVMVIISFIIFMIIGFVQQKTDEIRRDRAAMQMQLILNAGLAFYVNNGKWPITCDGKSYNLSALNDYLPSNFSGNNPWGNPYTISCKTPETNSTFSVTTKANQHVEAIILAGRLPLAGLVGIPDTSTTVIASVPIPGQNLNNARALNFGSIYHSGGCVPEPVCPANMKAQIFVVPVSVSGTYDFTRPQNVYPITSYTANAYGPDLPDSVRNCDLSQIHQPCNLEPSPPPTGTNNYWRVCLAINTERGAVIPQNAAQGLAMGSILAITRCRTGTDDTPEYTGSDFNVWSP